MLKSCHTSGVLEAGLDEAGRGCLAGPVYAAAVILDPEKPIEGLNDSKKLNHKQRLALREEIISKALAWSVQSVDNTAIDTINILNASIKAMHLAIDCLTTEPEHLIIDGNRFKSFRNIPHVCIIKGDGKYQSIAAASILAKTFRDEYMEKIHIEFPDYEWNKNKGYPTAHHRKMVTEIGHSKYHRLSFQVNYQMKLEL